MRPSPLCLPELTRALEAGERSSLELVEECLERIARCNGRLNIFLSVDEEGARRWARASDERRAAGRSRGPLDGVPYALKDNIVAENLPVTCASRLLRGFRSPYDSTLVERLRAAGAVLLGKVNLDEFAMGSSNEHSAFGSTRNPHDPGRVPGGSSGGSCAAVAAGLVPLAFGSDTGGSVRLPASFCGVVGVKPSYGRVSRYGLVAFASSLDQIGPIARTTAGAAQALAVVAGADPRDETSAQAPVPDYAAEAGGELGQLRAGVIREFLGEGVDPDVRRAIERAVEAFASLGAEIREVSLPHARYGIAAYYVLASAEASSNLARYDGVRYGRRAEGARDLEEVYVKSRSEGFGEEVKRRIMIGTFALSAGYHDEYYGRAMRARSLIRADYEEAFGAVDILLSPVCPSPAFRLGERLEDPLSMYLTDAMTVPASLAGIPAMSVPCGTTSQGLPVGLQIQAPFWGEAVMFRAAAAYEARAAAGRAPLPPVGETEQ